VKKELQVDRETLLAAIEDAEKNGPLKNLTALYKRVAEVYNEAVEGDLPEITHSVAKLRMEAWKLPHKTTSGKGIEVDKDKLTAAIQEAEKDGPLKNLSELWQAAAEIYNKTADRAITHSVVYLRAKEWEIPHQTVGGKRGGDGSQLRNRGPRKSRGEKLAGNEEAQQCFAKLREITEAHEVPRYLPLIEKIEKGSMAAAVKFHCLECCAFVTKEVRLCGCQECALWPFRPYQHQVEEDEVESEEKEAA
jgi:hypothetical protein